MFFGPSIQGKSVILPFSDNFSTAFDSRYKPLNTNTFSITSGRLYGTNATPKPVIAVNEDRQTNRIYVEGNLYNVTSGEGPGIGYILDLSNYIVIHSFGGANNIYLRCRLNGTLSDLYSTGTNFSNATDIIRLEIDGISKTYKLKKNGATFANGTLPSGFPVNSRSTGIIAVGISGSSSNYIDNFKTGDL